MSDGPAPPLRLEGVARRYRTEAGELPVLAAADTVLLTVPNQLGVDYNAHLIETVLRDVAPGLGWR